MPYVHAKGCLEAPHVTETTDVPGGGSLKDFANKDLFEHEPGVADVTQENLNDCFLEAALISILNTPLGPQRILDMMCDNSPGAPTVTVRLHDPEHVDQVNYITVSKEALKIQTGALWVKMFQKAYAAMGRGGPPDHGVQVADRPVTWDDTGALNGGHSSHVMKAILGSDARYESINNNRFFDDLTGLGTKNTLLHDGVFSAGNIYDAWSQWFSQGPGLAQWAQCMADHGIGVQYRYQDILTFLNDYCDTLQQTADGLTAHQDLLAHITENNALPGKRGTGIYDEEQMRIWGIIRGAIDAGQPVCVSTRESVSRGDSNTEGKGGEDMAKGLVGGHAYALLDYEIEILIPETGHERYWVELQNPWKEYTRTYKTMSTTEVKKATVSARYFGKLGRAKDDGRFKLPLADLTKRFNKVVIGEEALNAIEDEL
jgi:hypothetical protein